MNNVFGQKNLCEKKVLSDPPPGPPARRPAGALPGPKVVQIVPLGPLTPLKRSGVPKNHGKVGSFGPATLCVAKIMPKTRFWAILGVSGAVWARLGPPGPVAGPRNTKFKNHSRYERFGPKKFSGFSTTLKGSA